MDSAPTSRIVMLDGIRGIAALSVLFYHIDLSAVTLFDRGYLMVDLFFLLSGFVLTLSAEPRLRSDMSWRGFLLVRYRRLWPVLIAGVVLGAVVFALLGEADQWGAKAWIRQLIMAVLLIPTIWITRDASLFPFNRAHWSLFFEIVANFLHGLVLWRLSDRILLILTFLFAAMLAAAIRYHGDNATGPFQGDWLYGFPRACFSYIAGIWLARKWKAGHRAPRLPWIAVLALPLAGLAAITMLPPWIGDASAVLILFPLTIWLGASTDNLGKSGFILEWLGTISYPLYATHVPILLLLEELGSSIGIKLAALSLSIGVAWIISVLLERQRLRRRMAAAQAAD